MKRFFIGTVQVGGFILFSKLMNALAGVLELPVPGGILGIAVLFLLLQTKVIKVEWIDIGAKWLLAEMLLFFIPPAVGMMEHGDLIRESGLQLLAAVTGSVLVVMVGSGLIADKMAGRKGEGRP